MDCNTPGFPVLQHLPVLAQFHVHWVGDAILTICIYSLEIALKHKLDDKIGASQVVLMVKNPPANAGDIEMWVWSLGRKDPLEESMASHSSILAWRIPWTEEPVGLQSIGSHRVRHDWSDLAWIHQMIKLMNHYWNQARSLQVSKLHDSQKLLSIHIFMGMQKNMTSYYFKNRTQTTFLKYLWRNVSSLSFEEGSMLVFQYLRCLINME